MASQTVTERLLFPSQLAGRMAGTAAGRFTPERRRGSRTRIALPITVGLGKKKNAGLLANLAEDGIGMHALGRSIVRGATVALVLRLPGIAEPLRTHGVVAWVNGSAQAGIRFLDPSRALAGRLREWMAHHQLSTVAREFLQVAGGLQPALHLVAELVRTLTGASGVAITLLPRRPVSLPAGEGIPVTVHSMTDRRPTAGSTMAATLYDQQEIVGRLEMFFTELAFDEQDMRALRGFTAVLSEMIHIHRAESGKAAARASRLTSMVRGRIDDFLRWPANFRLPSLPRIKLHLR